nr:unnamed protein product [Digitaria exilis]
MASASSFFSLRLPTPSPSHATSSPSFSLPLLRQARGGAASSALVARAAPGAPSPLFNPRGDPFLSTLAAASPEDLATAAGGERRGDDHLPFLEIFQNAKLMASPAQVSEGSRLVERSSSSYSQHRPRRPPPDLPSLLLHGRIVYIGMPLVPAVTELVVAQLMYLEWMNSKEPVYIYINSTGTARDDGEPVGMESEGFAIYDAMMRMKAEIHTLCIGAAAGHACLVLAAGKKGKRYMFPHAKAMIQQPRIPSYGMMQASDVVIRAKEILWRGQEKYMSDMLSPDEWDKVAGVRRPDLM